MYFKAKDYVTAGNAVCGLASVVSVIEGSLYYASLFILVSWLFDTLDGVVARLTKTFNKFGGEFDNMCDHLTYGIAPGFLVFGVYREWMPGGETTQLLLACAIGFWLPLTATIRAARFTIKPIKVTGFWIGLPRPVSAFIVSSYFATSGFSEFPEFTYPFGLALVFALGAMNLGAIPFMSHHGYVWPRWVNWLLVGVVGSLSLSFLLGPLASLLGLEILPRELFFDFFFFWLFGYMLLQWWAVPAEDWQRAKDALAAWKLQPEPE